MTEAIDTRIGTVDLPERVDRERYFRDLTYMELSALFAGPLKPSSLAKWVEVAPKGTIGLVAPWVLSHRKPPRPAKTWPHDATVGDFRDSAHARAAIGELKAAAGQLGAACAVFTCPPVFAASAANRDLLRHFFAEIATEEAVGAPRVWIPDGLWDLRTALSFAKELGVTCAFDPLVREPGQPPEVHFGYDVASLYLRIAGLGRTGAIRPEQMDDLVALLEHYEGIPAIIAFDSPARWQDARNLKKSLGGA